jgi:carbonic anhydrase
MSNYTIRVALFAVLVMAIDKAGQSVAKEKQPSQSEVHHYFSKADHKHEVKWGYTGSRGPDAWATLSPKYKLARDGKSQSPIDIQTKKVKREKLPALRFDYRKERVSAINNGHTIQHNEKPGSFLYVGDRKYVLEQFHVHVPSEHTLDGRHTALEIHFVHKSESGEVAVVAVLAQSGEKNPIRLPQYKEIPKERGERVEAEGVMRTPLDFIPEDRHYYSYPGSFTTPPCTEGVRWIVMASTVEVGPEAIAEFKRAIGRNNRPIQPLFGRRVKVDPTQDQGE